MASTVLVYGTGIENFIEFGYELVCQLQSLWWPGEGAVISGRELFQFNVYLLRLRRSFEKEVYRHTQHPGDGERGGRHESLRGAVAFCSLGP